MVAQSEDISIETKNSQVSPKFRRTIISRSSTMSAQRANSSVSNNKPKKLDIVRDGKFFHIRVTVGYLTCLKINDSGSDSAEMSENHQNICAYASFHPNDKERGEYDCATSMPIAPGAPRQVVRWPKGNDVKTSKRRLYHSLLLRADDELDIKKTGSALSEDSDMQQAKSPFAAELLNIFIGLKRGEETLPIGVATLVVNGKTVEDQQMDLPVRKTTLAKVKPVVEREEEPVPNKRGLSKFFGGKKAPVKVKEEVSKKNPFTFSGDGKKYSFESNAVLKIKLDVMEGMYENNGPGLWGDLEDDEESFGPVPVIDIPDDCTVALKDKYRHESIEVLPFKHGTTIVASPGIGEAQENDVLRENTSNLEREQVEEITSDLDEYFDEPDTKEHSIFFCGAGYPSEDISEVGMTFATEEDFSETETEVDTKANGSARNGKAGLGGSSLSRYTDGLSEGDTNESSTREKAEAATSMLMRYASRMGVKVEELLQVADSEYETSSYGSSRHDEAAFLDARAGLYDDDSRNESSYDSQYSGQRYSA